MALERLLKKVLYHLVAVETERLEFGAASPASHGGE
jgi:hypothetical protein